MKKWQWRKIGRKTWKRIDGDYHGALREIALLSSGEPIEIKERTPRGRPNGTKSGKDYSRGMFVRFTPKQMAFLKSLDGHGDRSNLFSQRVRQAVDMASGNKDIGLELYKTTVDERVLKLADKLMAKQWVTND